jgi:hypothetical protein
MNALSKYALRGWSIAARIWPHKTPTSDSSGPFFLSTSRWVRDKHSWVVPLDVSGVSMRPRLSFSSPEFSWDPVVYNSWKLGTGDFPDKTLVMSYHGLGSTIIRYRYLVADEDLRSMFVEFFQQQGVLEHKKVSNLSDLNKLKTWTWYVASFHSYC